MRCLVTGGTGFIGSHIVKKLVDSGHEVIITGHEGEDSLPFFKGKRIFPSFNGVDWNAIGKIDVLFHQAALNDTQFMDMAEMLRVNFQGTTKLLNEILFRGCRKIIYASSTAVYGNQPAPYLESNSVYPIIQPTPYVASKRAVELYANSLANQYPDLSIIGLRYCNVYGPGEFRKGKRATMIYQIAQQMRGGLVSLFKHGEQKRDYIYVKDVVEANMLAMAFNGSGVFNCGSGTATTFNDLVSILSKHLKADHLLTTIYIDNPYKNYQVHTQCDMTKAKEVLGFVPKHSIDQGIEDYFNEGSLK
jgi:ADP-L-glycero-D-manno-heptose 6-epimerase